MVRSFCCRGYCCSEVQNASQEAGTIHKTETLHKAETLHETEPLHEAETLHETENLHETEPLHKTETFQEIETSLEAKNSLELKDSTTKMHEMQIQATEGSKADNYEMMNTLDGTTLDYEDTLSSGPSYSSPIVFLFFPITLATKFHKPEIREEKRRVPPLAEETVAAPMKWWLREETLEEARARVDGIIESEARFAMFEEMPFLDHYPQRSGAGNWVEWKIGRSYVFS